MQQQSIARGRKNTRPMKVTAILMRRHRIGSGKGNHGKRELSPASGYLDEPIGHQNNTILVALPPATSRPQLIVMS